MTPSHPARSRGPLTPLRLSRRIALARCASIAALFGMVLLAAKPSARGGSALLTTGLRYDIQMTTTTATTENGQPTASTNSALSHVEIANGKVRIDVAQGDFALAATGDFLILTDTSHTATLVKPDLKQYLQVDFQKLGTRLTGTANLFGGAIGLQPTNVKLDFASLGPGDKVGPFSTAKYRITQDYVLVASLLGTQQGKGTTMHSSTDYWFAPQLTMIVNPFAQLVQETAWLGPTYDKQLAALQAKLPKGVPVKSIMTDVATDSQGTKTTTTVTWELTSFVRADIPDAAFQIPAGYTPIQAPTALVNPLVPTGAPNSTNANGPLSGYVNNNALQAVGGTSGGEKGALSTLLKAAQQGAPPGAATGSTPGAPATTWNGNGSTQSAGTPSAWSAATSGGASGGASTGAATSTSPPATTNAQDTSSAATPPARKSHSP